MALKQFEKWKDDNCVKHCNLCHIGVCGNCTGIGTKGDVWRAALEWAEDRISESKSLGEALSKIIREIESKYDSDK